MPVKIEISKEKRNAMIAEIKAFYLSERDEEIGELGAILILDFFIDKLGIEIYNQGVYDSCEYMKKKVEDLLEIQKHG